MSSSQESTQDAPAGADQPRLSNKQEIVVPETSVMTVDHQQQQQQQQEPQWEAGLEDSFLVQVFAKAFSKKQDPSSSFASSTSSSSSASDISHAGPIENRSVGSNRRPAATRWFLPNIRRQSVVPSAIGVPVESEAPSTLYEIAVVGTLGRREDPPTTTTSKCPSTVGPNVSSTATYSTKNRKRSQLIWSVAVVFVAAIAGAVAGFVASSRPQVKGDDDEAGEALSPRSVVPSTFDVQLLDGWSLGGAGIALDWDDEGFISGRSKGVPGESWYFVAPSKFHGNLLECELSFELKQDLTDDYHSPSSFAQLILGSSSKAGRIGLSDPTFLPGLNFTKFELVIRAENSLSWVDASSSASLSSPASTDAVQKILSSVDYLAIRGDYQIGVGTGSLDNVNLSCGE